LNTWKRYCSATGAALGNCSADALAVKSTTDDVILRSLAGETTPGAETFNVDPSAAAEGPEVAGATGLAGFAELHASAPAVIAHTPNIVHVLRVIQSSRDFGFRETGDRNAN
jgi:hypothetical protein